MVKNTFPGEEKGRDLKVALYLAQRLSNAACQVALRHAAPFHPARQPPAWSGELLPGLFLKHPQQPHTRVHSKPSITVPVSPACNQYSPSDSVHTCDGRQKASGGRRQRGCRRDIGGRRRERGGRNWLARRGVFVMGAAGEGTGGKKRDDKKNVQRLDTNNIER